MVQENHIDKALAFMESLEKLGNQLKAAEEHQKQLIARMLDLKKENLTDGEEYAELSQKSKSLQDIIDKWRRTDKELPLSATHLDRQRILSIHGIPQGGAQHQLQPEENR